MKNSSLGDLRLLYVEDDDSTLQALTRVLSKQFKEVITASDGAEVGEATPLAIHSSTSTA
jgi:response regulator RpfG family c-di-GMP phosphodiesterase